MLFTTALLKMAWTVSVISYWKLFHQILMIFLNQCDILELQLKGYQCKILANILLPLLPITSLYIRGFHVAKGLCLECYGVFILLTPEYGDWDLNVNWQ